MEPPTPKQETDYYAAWRRMHTETQAVLGGSRDPALSHDLSHVATYPATMARYRTELALRGSTIKGRRAAYKIRITTGSS